jgi:response regulator RpfG family c-di-GMP phosphodiesterase
MTEQTHTILIVDDEPVVLGALKETLERERYHVVACSSPIKALSILAERQFAVIISDQRMPEMLGLDFLVESRKTHPNASRILVTAVLAQPGLGDEAEDLAAVDGFDDRGQREELLATVRNAIQRHDLIVRNEALQARSQQLNAQLTVANSELGQKVQDLETERLKLDAANTELSARYNSSLELCRRILTAYDPVLGGQAKTLVEFASKMGETEHFSGDERQSLLSAAWLCDLGLIGISRELLRTFRTSPGSLTERERNTLQNHPVYSQTLASLVDPRPEIGAIIRAHHERFDGTGYPDGLVGKGIPWSARCLSVAVGYVESGLPKQAAIDQLLARSGTYYDPEAVRLFLKVSNLVNLPRSVREILLDELEPGMVLASGIYSPHGLLLIGEGQLLGPATITKIHDHNQITPISQRLLVYS